MIKYFGIMLLFISCVMIGVFKVSRLSNHISVLQSTVNMLNTFQRELNYSQPLLSELFCTYSDEVIDDFALLLSQSVKDCNNLESCVAECIRNSQSLAVLSKAEKETLEELLSSLGASDIDSQVSLLSGGIGMFDEFLTSAKTQKEKNSKVYLTFSIYIGLAAAVLLL